jgi:hypothetical protein
MTQMRRGLMALGLVLLLSGFGGAARAQQNTTPGRPPVGADGLPPMGLDLPPQRERQAKLLNDDRQKQLVADTDKLLQLATELHADVAKTNKNVLSVDVIKRADEIEKLAHSVKMKMKG